MSAARGNLLIVQGGGPTPVLNATLCGVVDEARNRGGFAKILGARFGVVGLIKSDLIDLSNLSAEQLALLRVSPGATLGSTRHKLRDDDLEWIVTILRENQIGALLLIGGNGSLRGAELIAIAVTRAGLDTIVVGVPKTVDNDIPRTDRCPGFGSAARYAAQAVRDLGMDVRSLPQPVSLFETMGRSVGWLAGATVLGKLDESHAPHLIYLPEQAFDLDAFLGDIDRIVAKHGWCVAVVNEGLKDARGEYVFQTNSSAQRDALDRPVPGGVASFLANEVASKLKMRCRWEQPGLCGRSSMLHVSQQDLSDAEVVGRAGVRAAIDRKHGHMVSLRPLSKGKDAWEVVPLCESAGGEKLVPREWMNDSDTAVGPAFIEYVRPIVGELVEYAIPLKDVR